MVREGGIEPPRAFAHKILSLARLPISPLPQRVHWHDTYHSLRTIVHWRIRVVVVQRPASSRDGRSESRGPVPPSRDRVARRTKATGDVPVASSSLLTAEI